jgi:hypothetical protein
MTTHAQELERYRAQNKESYISPWLITIPCIRGSCRRQR